MTCLTLVSISLVVGCLLAAASADPFHHHFNETWGGPRVQILDNGGLVTLTLDRYSGSGFVSKKEYIFGKFEVQLKLVPGYSAGTVTAFYGIPFPSNQPMKIYSSIWNADDWATKGGVVKTDYSKEPFPASFRNFSTNGCVVQSGTSSCDTRSNLEEDSWLSLDLDLKSRKLMKRVRDKYVFYDYCTDKKRFFKGLPPECTISNKLDNYYLSSSQ